jgi:hypothetical protein
MMCHIAMLKGTGVGADPTTWLELLSEDEAE